MAVAGELRCLTEPPLDQWDALQLRHFLLSLPDHQRLSRPLTLFEQTCKKEIPTRHAISSLYSMMISPSPESYPPFMAKWENYLNTTFTPAQKDRILHLAHHSSIASKTQELGYKIVSRVPTVLHAMFHQVSPLCTVQLQITSHKMESQKEEQKLTAGGNKRFVIPSQEPETTPVRPLFHAPSSVLFHAPSSVSSTNVVSGGSYADYIFNKEAKGPERKVVDAKLTSSLEHTSLVPNSGSAQKIQKGTLRIQQCPQTMKADSGSEKQPPSGMEGFGTEQKTENGKGGPFIVTSSGGGPSAIKDGKSVGGKSCIVVSTRQRGNPLLKHVRNIPWEFGDIVPDYILGDTCCALFLSLRYHNLNPEYIHSRLKTLGQAYALRVLLVQVDVKDPHFTLKELAKICILSDLTLILSWSPDEAARYLETYKCYEQKPADALKERTESDFMSKITDCLTTVKSVNKTDSCTLLTTFGTLSDLANASREDLSLCPGFGPQKAKRLFDALHEPFLKTK
ncbi:PREDICTED: DNA excision repair protein ERCC-1 [Nanorana parkeri]|uniref:DNA excision repair protein ERCC-1 n=1 Tax=Nanorana parkeri TaxID=125878 RepID=UPI000854167F|nr:PREDICTED: DNA excision repair protein ERCC-1 [Nanorana parkeri]